MLEVTIFAVGFKENAGARHHHIRRLLMRLSQTVCAL